MTEITMELLLALAKEDTRHSNVDAISCAPTSSSRTNYYQSVFRIDGQPILPPLMTTEKRFEMLKFKEVAMEREAQRRELLQCPNEQSKEAGDTATLVNKVFETKVNVQSAANRFYDALHTQPLEDTPKLNCEPKKYINASTCTDTGITVECKRVQHLQRSETIIYDNRCNSIIMPMDAVHELRQRGQALMVAEESENLHNTTECTSMSEAATSKTTKTQPSKVISAAPYSPKRPQSLTFDTTAQTQQQQIPAICVNPPTPQVDPRVQSTSHTHNFVDLSRKCTAAPRQLDDKCELLQLHKQVSNSISPKIIHYDNATATTVNMKPKSPCCDDKLKRSITSPSLKIVVGSGALAFNNNNSLNISNMSDEKAQCLMRSNSFTLERPSKVLLEHMERQQTLSHTNKQDYWTKSEDINAQQQQQSVAHTRSTNNSNSNHQAHFRRDTVESKAKRVNKIEVKQRMAPVRNTAKFKQKSTVTNPRPSNASTNLFRSNVSAVSSPNISTRHNAHPVSHSNSNTSHIYASSNSMPRITSLPLNKNKRTVYEPRAVASQPQQQQSQQQQLPIKRPQKKVTTTAKTLPATMTSRSLINTTQRSAAQQPLNAQQQQTGLQLHQQQQQQQSANYNSQNDQHPKTQTHQQPKQLTHSQHLQLKLQQLQQQRQLARSTLSPTLMSQQMLSEIETAHRQKFMQLIAQQHEEQRRLQAQFDAQQKLLLEQICSEMSTSQLSGDDSRLSGGEYTTDNETKFEHRDESNSSTPDSPGDSVSSVVGTIQRRDSIKSLTSSPVATTSSKTAMIDTTTIQSGSSTAASTPLSQISVSANGRDSSGCNTQTPHNLSLHLKNNNASSGVGANSARKRLNFGNNCRAGTPTQQMDFVIISDRPAQANRHTLPRSSTGSLPETRRAAQHTAPLTPTRLQIVNENENQQQRLREAAATKINACARGFLVRRIFRTEQIQRVVQTIRDTLIFVLNLHLETSNNGVVGADEDTPANVRLKARLLQQLCSASRTLHLVFFQTTLRERMEIISRDRKRLKTKMIAINLKRSAHIMK